MPKRGTSLRSSSSHRFGGRGQGTRKTPQFFHSSWSKGSNSELEAALVVLALLSVEPLTAEGWLLFVESLVELLLVAEV